MKATDNIFPNNDTLYAGLKARDYIAIQAMTGLLSNTYITPSTTPNGIAKDAYRVADAMIKQSEVKE